MHWDREGHDPAIRLDGRVFIKTEGDELMKRLPIVALLLAFIIAGTVQARELPHSKRTSLGLRRRATSTHSFL
jgi:hypothetical protein